MRLPRKLNKISVALCTFNGSKYIGEQLESILKQSLTPDELVICDDASSDSTTEIAHSFKEKASFKITIVKNEERVGVQANFSKAIGLCSNSYVALADQDDIWLEDRLLEGWRYINEAERTYGEEVPILVHSDLSVVDEKGRVIAPSLMKNNNIRHQDINPINNLVVQNFVTGSTVIINRSLINAALPLPQNTVMHDWWLALIAAAMGRVIFVPKQLVLYRQHHSNIVGARLFISYANLRRLNDVSSLEANLATSISQGIALKERLCSVDNYYLPEPLFKYLQLVKVSGLKTAVLCLRYKIGMYPWLRNLVFIILLLKGGYRKRL